MLLYAFVWKSLMEERLVPRPWKKYAFAWSSECKPVIAPKRSFKPLDLHGLVFTTGWPGIVPVAGMRVDRKVQWQAEKALRSSDPLDIQNDLRQGPSATQISFCTLDSLDDRRSDQARV
jgi:hypothetical protein